MKYLKYLLIIPQFLLAFVGIALTAISTLLTTIADIYIEWSYMIDDIRNDSQ